mgnify:CR=1 FL=1|tara:strand:+ start:46 stop:840 length:795 start_codon:yes stop_codon:yes gene_type:complete
MDINKSILEIKKEGFTVIESVLTDEEIKSLKSTVIKNFKSENSINSKVNTFHKNSQIVYNLQNKDLLFYELICNKNVIKIADVLLKEGSYLNSEPYILCQSTARNPGPFSDEQQLHIDSNIPGLPFCFYLQAMWNLDDFNEKSGGTRFVPGSHLIKKFAENNVKYKNEVQIIAPKGSLILFDGGVWHGSSKSMLNKDRWIIINTYCRWFLKQSFDIPRGIDNSIFNNLNDSQKELLGFRCVPPLNENERKTRISDDFFNPHKLN